MKGEIQIIYIYIIFFFLQIVGCCLGGAYRNILYEVIHCQVRQRKKALKIANLAYESNNSQIKFPRQLPITLKQKRNGHMTYAFA